MLAANLAVQEDDRPLEEKKYSVTEIFGPTMQGEGPLAGHQVVFVRLHFCDGDQHKHWCSWCDTRYSWDRNDPGFSKYRRLTANEIADRVSRLAFTVQAYEPCWVVLSGGNPVLQMDNRLVDTLAGQEFRIQVETQGTAWHASLRFCDRIVVSPKPPSSGMTDLTEEPIWSRWLQTDNVAFKVVIFDDNDFDWACKVYREVVGDGIVRPFYLSAGTDIVGDPDIVVLDKYQWLVKKWLASRRMPTAVVLPQLHVLVWGRQKGV